MSNAKAQPGVGVDAGGGAVIDPTANVIALVEAETKRQDDLRASAKELSDTKHAHQQEIDAQRAIRQRQTHRRIQQVPHLLELEGLAVKVDGVVLQGSHNVLYREPASHQ